MKIKTSKLTGPALDWAVAKCEGAIWTGDWYSAPRDGSVQFKVSNSGWICYLSGTGFNPSTDWSQGGPIIERELISVRHWGRSAESQWEARHPWKTQDDYGTNLRKEGPTPLIAAMRCYCCAKLGDEVDIPEELE